MLGEHQAFFAVYGHLHAAKLIGLGLQATRVGEHLKLVSHPQAAGRWDGVTSPPNERPSGSIAIGQWRRLSEERGLPFSAIDANGPISIAMSGRSLNGETLRSELMTHGRRLFSSHSEGELILQLMSSSSQKNLPNRLVDALWRVRGAFSLAVITNDTLIAIRGPRGIRPLILGHYEGAVLIATDERSILAIGGQVQRELKPGEMLIFNAAPNKPIFPFPTRPTATCGLEHLALASPGSTRNSCSVLNIRDQLAKKLSPSTPTEDAIVVGLPGDDSIAIRFAEHHGLRFRQALVSGVVGPTASSLRGGALKLFYAEPAHLRSRTVYLVIPILGNERRIREAISALLLADALEVHLRVASPPLTQSCLYGVHTPQHDHLLSHTVSKDHWSDSLLISSLEHLSLVEFQDTVGASCTACLGGPLPITPEKPTDQLTLFNAGAATQSEK